MDSEAAAVTKVVVAKAKGMVASEVARVDALVAVAALATAAEAGAMVARVVAVVAKEMWAMAVGLAAAEMMAEWASVVAATAATAAAAMLGLARRSTRRVLAAQPILQSIPRGPASALSHPSTRLRSSR